MTRPARVEVRRAGPSDAAVVQAVILPAFQARTPLEPPAAALTETVEDMAALLEKGGGLIAAFEGEDVGALVLDPVGPTMYLRRFGVSPLHQGHGVARALIDAAVEEAQDFEDLTVVAREELPNTVRFWERQGFREIRRSSPNVELRRPLRTFIFDVPDAAAMRELGADLAEALAKGDLIVLAGELGAGKTTFAQGLGEGLGVRGPVTSPTFVIAREHPSLDEGPSLVHVDAYRLGGIGELDDLDLDTSLDEAVTVVEWGEGVAEGLAESRLEVRIIRALAHEDEHGDLDPRRVLMTPVGPRWHDLVVPDQERAPLAEKVNETLMLDFRACQEDEWPDLDSSIGITLAVVTPVYDGEVLLVRNLRNGEWELSGGRLEGDDEPGDAAIRCYTAEVGDPPGEFDCIGVATVQLGHARTITYVACYRLDLPARPKGSAREVCWWNPENPEQTIEALGLSPIDAHLAELCFRGR